MRAAPSISRVLLVRLDHVGDCVLTVPPVARAIRRAAPEVRVHALTTAAGASLVGPEPCLERVLVFDAPWSVPAPGLRRTRRSDYLRRVAAFARRRSAGEIGRYDAILYLSMSPVERWLTAGLAPVRVGFEGPYGGLLHRLSERLLTHRVRFDDTRHVLRNCYELLARLWPASDAPMETELRISLEARRRGRERLGPANPAAPLTIGIHPGATGSFKQWPPARFAELAAEICRRYPAECRVIAAPQDEPQAREIAAASGHPRARPLVTADMEQFAAVAANCDVVIANDGGPAHVAAALGRPTVAIFGPTDERVFGPLGRRVRVVRKPHPAAPCAYPWRVRRPCCAERECLTRLGVDDVMAAAEGFLEEAALSFRI